MQSSDSLSEHWRHCSRHRTTIERSTLCGCFSCGAMFAPAAINEWISEPENQKLGLSAQSACTAICPECGIDAVLPGHAVPLTRELLSEMNARFFTHIEEDVRLGPTGPS